MTPRTGAERYLEGRLKDAEYRAAYSHAREQIAQVDRVIRVLDERRSELSITKAELARRAEMPPDAVRRLFSAGPSNPTLRTLTAIAEVLGLDIAAVERTGDPKRSGVSQERSDDAQTRQRTA